MTVRAATQDGVLEVVLDDAARGNVVDLAWVDAMMAALAGADADVGCVLIRAEGRNFGLGGDVTTFVGEDPAGDLRRLVAGVHEVCRRVVALDVPLVVAVQGWAAGFSMSLTLLGDVVIAGSSARFKTAYTGIGLISDGGMTWTLPRRVPHALAMDLLLTDRVLAADEAVRVGVVSRICEDERLVDEAREVARRLAAGPRGALGTVRRLVLDGAAASFDAQLDAEEEAMVAAVVAPEGREGVQAFLDRRAPDFGAARRGAGGQAAERP